MAEDVYKTPVEVKDYTINWLPDNNAPLAIGENIATSAWDIGGASDLSLGPAPSSFTNTTTTVWLSKGIANNIYTVTNTITTTEGRTFTDSFLCTVQPTNPPIL